MTKKSKDADTAEENDGSVRTEPRKLSLPCKLTETELIENGGAIAALFIANAGLDKELADEKEAYKQIKETLEGKKTSNRDRLSQLSTIISTGNENRQVDCEAVFDYRAGRVTVRRLDTDEVFEDRELENLEKQMQLQWEEENGQAQDDTVVIDPAKVVCAKCEGSCKDPDDSSVGCDECHGLGVPAVRCTADGCDLGLLDNGDACEVCGEHGYVPASSLVVVADETAEAGTESADTETADDAAETTEDASA